MYFFDSETCGLHGPMVLLQYKHHDDDFISMHSVFHESIGSTMEIIETLVYDPEGVVGFNLSFDWFHICQTYTTLSLLASKVGRSEQPIHHINEYAICEPEARFGYCLKPTSALDLMLHARKGPYQSTMNRGDVRIKRVPTQLAWIIADELTRRIPLPDIYFSKRQDPKVRWQVFDITNDLGDIVPEFKDIVLKFSPSSALKALVVDAGITDKDTRLLFTDVEVSKKLRPVEFGYAPFALAHGEPGDWRGTWPDVIEFHANHWTFNPLAREYAEDDVWDTEKLYHFFNKPDLGDTDSLLACMVGAVRWRGYSIDTDKIKALRTEAVDYVNQVKRKFNFQATEVVKKYLRQVMDETEALVIAESTKAAILEDVAKWKIAEVCEDCMGMGCEKCDEGLIETEEKHPAALRAREVLDARHMKKEIENYDKLLKAGRFHASFNVLGTLSSRMSGADGLNAQGIKRADQVRACFPLADRGLILTGGDFAGFEVCLCDAVYGDPILHEELISGKKIHGLFGTTVFPTMTYEEIVATKGAPNPEDDIYTRSKNGLFALIYMGEAYTLSNRVGISEADAEKGYQRFINRYKVFGEKRKMYADMFASMRQPGGIGTKVIWHEPKEFIESMFGFRRYFTLENKICKVLFKLANNPPDDWKKFRFKVNRRDREQTAQGAAQSACYAAAFAVQASNMRAAGNHVIQSSGAQLTKRLQKRIWHVQPTGIGHWVVQPMNVHDEIMCPARPDKIPEIMTIVKKFVTNYTPDVPLLEIDWQEQIDDWSGK